MLVDTQPELQYVGCEYHNLYIMRLNTYKYARILLEVMCKMHYILKMCYVQRWSSSKSLNKLSKSSSSKPSAIIKELVTTSLTGLYTNNPTKLVIYVQELNIMEQ